MTPQQFVEKWRDAKLKERSSYQEHFIDLCHLIEHPTPAQADPTGTWFTFEAFADKTNGGTGFADVWKKGFFAWEYKGKHADLDKAYQQLLQYREALFNPPLLVVCDFERIIVHTNFTNTSKQLTEIALDALLTAHGREQLRAIFYEPFQFKSPQTTAQVTEHAAREFGKLAEQLRKYGLDAPTAAHFLIRVLFCLFAEDVGLLPNKIFSQLVKRKWNETSQLTQQLRELFRTMARGGYFGVEEIKKFNGGLFDDDAAHDASSLSASLDSDGLKILQRVSDLDWSSIEPSIFGTLFERSLDPAKRSQIGAHYTSRADIELIVEPVLMLPLRRRWLEIQNAARALAAQREEFKGNHTSIIKKRAQLDKQLQTMLMGFTAEIARVQVLDPACGSGNFLYVALKALLDMEKSVSAFMRELRVQPAFPTVHPSQLHGIEINAYAYELAQATVWIGYIQWLHENGYGFPPEPILQPLHNFQNIDAIINLRDVENLEGLEAPREPEWQSADVIIGNPPFLGDKKMRAELGDEYVDALRALYAERIPGQSDLVCYWFEKARAMIASGQARRAGLLATNSIRGGANRRVLERIKETGDIFFAVSDRDWILDGAAVNISMVGFDNGSEKEKSLDGNPSIAINSDLTGFADITSAKSLKENLNLSFIGTQKSGDFDLTPEQADAMLDARGNPNRKSNRDIVKPWTDGQDITGRSRHMWIIDFGTNMSLEEAAQYELPFEHVKKNVKPFRDNVRRKNHRERWWLHGETRVGMRKALANLSRYIATPRVSKHRVFVWIPSQVLADSAVVAIARDDEYFFGVLHSKLHQLWALRMGTSLETRPLYTPTTTFETFPFPFLPGQENQNDPRVIAIADAARALVELRDNWLNPRAMDGRGEALTDADANRAAPAHVNASPLRERDRTLTDAYVNRAAPAHVNASSLRERDRTLTNLYNQNPQWLQNAHRKLDDAVLDAYGWSRALSDAEILEKLLALNLERAREQQT
ncbi:MAG: class I SAM-dependent DNA methyltransferase [Chloroflexota bacterium]|nr:MAG: class I SAM-dependent DNA methyltransferase [Chloroflexota bacterium]